MMETTRSKPIPVVDYDIVGYMGDDKFVILNHMRSPAGRDLPYGLNELFPSCIPCVVKDGQTVNFDGEVVSLQNDGDGKWSYRFHGALSAEGMKPISLAKCTFFEIGNGL